MADVTYTFTSEATLGGEKKTIDHSGTVSGVTQVYDQLIPLTTTKQTALTYGAAEAGATLAAWTMLVLENLSSTAAEVVEIAFSQASAVFWVEVPAGRIFVMWNRNASIDDDAAAGGTASMASITSVAVRSQSGTPNLRIVAYDDS